MKTIKATIYGSPDEYQEVEIEYEAISRNPLFAPSSLDVNYCRVLDALLIKPNGIAMDLEIAIAENEGYHPGSVGISCEIVIPNVVDHKLNHEMLFV